MDWHTPQKQRKLTKNRNNRFCILCLPVVLEWRGILPGMAVFLKRIVTGGERDRQHEKNECRNKEREGEMETRP